MHLHSLLDQRVTVLTASRRLAHAIRLDYARHATSQGLSAWRTPRVLPWTAWLRQHWLETRALSDRERHARLLTRAQASFIWSDIVSSSDAGAHLLNPATAARVAATSWQRMQQYLIPLERLATADGAEAQALYAWSCEFVRRCAALDAIDEARLPQWAYESAFMPPGAESIALAGFDVVPPSLQRLLEHWRTQNKVHDIAQAEHLKADVLMLPASDAQAEVELAARWARAQLVAGRRSIGVLIGDLDGRRAEVSRMFEDVFAPGLRITQPAAVTLPVTLAAPPPLNDYPVVDGALLVLQLALPEGTSLLAGRVLRSPFLAGGESERDRRALADLRLRNEQRDQWDWFEIERWAGVTGCPRLQLAARAVGTLLRADSGQAQPSRWVERFHAWLKAAGWPGERTLDSVEHQCVLKLHAALAEFGTLDAVTTVLPLSLALGRLQDLLRDTPFEPQSQATAVTVIDPATLAGMTFDALWVAGLDATRLPGPVSPDPLLPLDIQRSAGLLEASAEGTLQLARVRLARWIESAPQVVLSWPERDGEASLQPSPLLAPWAREESPELTLAAERSLRRTLFEQRPALHEMPDERAPAVPAGAARGGASTLELQSRCPFRAQAELRLHARALSRVRLGVEPVDRGTILHRALAEIWGALVTHSALIAADEQQLAELVRSVTQRHVVHAVRPTARYRVRLAALEVESLTRQILRLLQVEKGRAPFTVRVAEEREAYAIGGLAITLQPDRIDELQDGGQLLIDYKLGDSHQPRQWLDARPGRPRRPQLPLYALAHERTLRALAFVVLAPGATEYRGWSDGAQAGAGITPYPGGTRLRLADPPDWTALLRHWRITLTNLATQFVAGAASVDPLPQECATCHLSTFCRIHEQAAIDSEHLADE